jgi:aquaporin Z
VRHAEVALRSIGQPNSVAGEFDFWNDSYEGRRLFSELLGTFFLVLVAVGGGMVSARFGGNAVPYTAKVVAPALMVMAIILFMGTVSGAHLNPAVSIAFAARGDFPWRGRGGDRSGVAAAQGTLGLDWRRGARRRRRAMMDRGS